MTLNDQRVYRKMERGSRDKSEEETLSMHEQRFTAKTRLFEVFKKPDVLVYNSRLKVRTLGKKRKMIWAPRCGRDPGKLAMSSRQIQLSRDRRVDAPLPSCLGTTP